MYHPASAHRADVVLLDILTPCRRLDVCRTLRANPSTTAIAIIVVTTVERAVLTIDAARLRIAAVIFRPSSPTRVWRTVSTVLGTTYQRFQAP